jgi:hypothetical protein
VERKNALLTILLAVLVAAAFGVMKWNATLADAAGAGKPILSFDSAAVDRLDFASPRFHGTVIHDTSGWRIISPFHSAADSLLISSILSELHHLAGASSIAMSKDDYARYHVDSSGASFTVSGSGHELASLYVGACARESEDHRNTYYVRSKDAAEVWQVKTFLGSEFLWDADLWPDKHVFSTNISTLSRIDYQFGDTVFSLVKSDSIWMIDGHRAHPDVMREMLGTLESLSAFMYADSMPANSPAPEGTLTLDGHVIAVYPAAADFASLITVSPKPQVYSLPRATANQFLLRRGELLRGFPSRP